MQNGWCKSTGGAELILFLWKKWTLERFDKEIWQAPFKTIILEYLLTLI